jgi:small subunit ribosomal protein S1
VYVLTPEDRRGQMIVSLAKAQVSKSWLELTDALKNGESLEAVISGYNKGGLVVDIKGLNGFIPFSHLESLPANLSDETELQNYFNKMIGKKITVRIIELDRVQSRIILSQKEAILGESLKKRQNILTDLKEGQIKSGTVTAIMPYGIMLDIGGLEGLVPVEEVFWDENNEDMLSKFELGSTIEAKIIEIDESLAKVKLSVKRITSNPWQEVTNKHKVGDVIGVNVSKITSYGVFVNIGDIEGMIPLTSFPADTQLNVGQNINARIDLIDSAGHRLDLSFVKAAE